MLVDVIGIHWIVLLPLLLHGGLLIHIILERLIQIPTELILLKLLLVLLILLVIVLILLLVVLIDVLLKWITEIRRGIELSTRQGFLYRWINS